MDLGFSTAIIQLKFEDEECGRFETDEDNKGIWSSTSLDLFVNDPLIVSAIVVKEKRHYLYIESKKNFNSQ